MWWTQYLLHISEADVSTDGRDLKLVNVANFAAGSAISNLPVICVGKEKCHL